MDFNHPRYMRVDVTGHSAAGFGLFKHRQGKGLPLLVLLLSLTANCLLAEPVLTPGEYKALGLSNSLAGGERLWKGLENPSPSLGVREIFMTALTWCEANTHLDRLEKLFITAAKMQDRNPASRTYGNFRWSWGHEEVYDLNAVDFAMQTAAMIWMHHRERLPTAARAKLKELLELGIEGLKRHRVAENYTNIALMNAGDLILLGEMLANTTAAEEGYARLDRFIACMWEGGTHEYDSPTYYGVDLEDLELIEAYCQRERGRQQARALLEYFWTDIAANWFAGSQKLGGARSRDYDYLAGLGVLDQHLLAFGWLPCDNPKIPNNLLATYARWPIPERLRQLAVGQTPRLVEQVWGFEPYQARVHYVCPDVSLSASGASYGGRMDLPLTVDLPGPRKRTRGYYIPDARQDPYGKIKIAESKAHSKTLHLNPFWTATQRRVDALGLVVYREKDLNPTNDTLQTHFVLPLDDATFFIGEEQVKFTPQVAAEYPVPPGAAVILRQGTAAVGIKVPFARGLDGKPVGAALACDANPYGAVRLTVNHHTASRRDFSGSFAACSLWVRIGSGLTDATFATWRQEFAQAGCKVDAQPESIRIQAAGVDGPLGIAAATPFFAPAELEPKFKPFLLAVNGDDMGRRLLQAIEPIKSMSAANLKSARIILPASGQVYWEAEQGCVLPPMALAQDPQASGGWFGWMSAQPGERGTSATGRINYSLKIPQAGEYYLWGRVLSPTPENDSFTLRVEQQGNAVRENSTWNVGTHKQWTWVRFTPENSRLPQAIKLPAGDLDLQVRVREAGTKIDRLYLTRNREEVPK